MKLLIETDKIMGNQNINYSTNDSEKDLTWFGPYGLEAMVFCPLCFLFQPDIDKMWTFIKF